MAKRFFKYLGILCLLPALASGIIVISTALDPISYNTIPYARIILIVGGFAFTYYAIFWVVALCRDNFFWMKQDELKTAMENIQKVKKKYENAIGLLLQEILKKQQDNNE
jgi:hypothetical protein